MIIEIFIHFVMIKGGNKLKARTYLYEQQEKT